MDEAPDRDRRGTLTLAAVAGMGALIALPMSVVAPASLLVLVFSSPLMLIAIGAFHSRPWLRTTGIALLVATGAALAAPVEALAIVPTLVVLLGPVVAVIAVGPPLRDADLPAAAGFLLSGTIAVIAGFAAADQPGATALVLGVALVGITIVLVRLGRR